MVTFIFPSRRVARSVLGLSGLCITCALLACASMGEKEMRGNAFHGNSASVNEARSPGSGLCAPLKMLVLGDSLSAGYRISKAEVWPTLLTSLAGKAGVALTVSNKSQLGLLSQGGVTLVPGLLQRESPDVIVLELGAVDAVVSLDIETIRSNLTLMIRSMRELAPKAIIFLAEIRPTPRSGTDYGDAFERMFSEVAHAQSIELIPSFLDHVSGVHERLLPDGLHPNAVGHEILVRTVWDALRVSPALGARLYSCR